MAKWEIRKTASGRAIQHFALRDVQRKEIVAEAAKPLSAYRLVCSCCEDTD
jgi:hypothetical protein